ncbi:phage portal protein BeeE [Rhizobium sp. SG_E_25_P2]|nr:phage portal protein BeeE [Rhizobium sp. SG_E_25_P2]
MIYGEDIGLSPDLDQASGLAVARDALRARVGARRFLTDPEKREAVGY